MAHHQRSNERQMPATGGSSSIPNNNASSQDYQTSNILNLYAKD
jgi:hypothetical protein